MMRVFGLAVLAVLVVGVSSATATIESSGWDDFPAGDTGVGVYAVDAPKPTDYTEPLLGKYGNVNEMVDNTIYHSAPNSLKLVDMSATGPSTPQAYIGWVEGLNVGDQVTASVWVYDTVSGSPSGRIWGHYNANHDIDTYDGSANGNADYGSQTGWSQLSWTWTYTADDYGDIGDRTGLVIEFRTYSTDGDTVWIDDLEITAPDYATICKPQIPEPATLALLAMGGLVALRRRK